MPINRGSSNEGRTGKVIGGGLIIGLAAFLSQMASEPGKTKPNWERLSQLQKGSTTVLSDSDGQEYTLTKDSSGVVRLTKCGDSEVLFQWSEEGGTTKGMDMDGTTLKTQQGRTQCRVQKALK